MNKETELDMLAKNAKNNGTKIIEDLIKNIVKRYREINWFLIKFNNNFTIDEQEELKYTLERELPEKVSLYLLHYEDKEIKLAREYNKRFNSPKKLSNNGIYFCSPLFYTSEEPIPIITNESELKKYDHFKIKTNQITNHSNFEHSLTINYRIIDIKRLLEEAKSGILSKKGIYSKELIDYFIESYDDVKQKEKDLESFMQVLRTNEKIIYNDICEMEKEHIRNNRNNGIVNDIEMNFYTLSNKKNEPNRYLINLFNKLDSIPQILYLVHKDESGKETHIPIDRIKLGELLNNSSDIGIKESYFLGHILYVVFDLKQFKKATSKKNAVKIKKRNEIK